MEVSSQAPSCLNKRPSVGRRWAAFSGPFRSLLQVQFAPSPASMGCGPRPCAVTLSQLSIYGSHKVFSLNKSKEGGWHPSPAGLDLLAGQEFQGSPRTQADFPSRPPGFWGWGGRRVGRERANAACPVPLLRGGCGTGFLWSPALLLPCVLGKPPPLSWCTQCVWGGVFLSRVQAPSFCVFTVVASVP